MNDHSNSGCELALQVTYETRYQETTHADQILPFVLDALNTVGLGSACVVRDNVGNAKGIQLTAPVDLALLLISTIQKLNGIAPPNYEGNVFYPPLLYVAGNSGVIAATIEQLRLIPPDMHLAWIEVDGTKVAIAISGPRVRNDAFNNNVLPSLSTLVRNLEMPGFPIG
jgi:hypothetical protein